MYNRNYRGAYSRRRFSNASTIIGAATQYEREPYVQPGQNVYYSLDAYSQDTSMGGVLVTLISQSVTADNGSGAMDFGNGNGNNRFAEGSVVKVWAKANTGYRFVSWATNIPNKSNTQENPISLTMNRSYQLIARFERINMNYTLTVNWNRDHGRVAASGEGLQNGQMSVRIGDQVTLSAQPKDGYVFKRWEGIQLGGNVQDNTSRTITVTMPARPLTLTAVFEKSAQTPGGGGGTPGGGSDDHNPQTPSDPATVPTETPSIVDIIGGGNVVNHAAAFAKKWWWALLIAAYIIYKETKGGHK